MVAEREEKYFVELQHTTKDKCLAKLACTLFSCSHEVKSKPS